jgi:hypothetical protein
VGCRSALGTASIHTTIGIASEALLLTNTARNVEGKPALAIEDSSAPICNRRSVFRIVDFPHKYDLSSDCLPLTKVDRYVQLKADPPKYIFPAQL